MANLQKFTLKDSWKDWVVTLEADLDIRLISAEVDVDLDLEFEEGV
ncbi:hypothetical protein GHT74_25460 [Pseudomonas aeruginosa]|nr:hypothetical protein [Pseudomonas aeruginosa]MBG5383016.1 hypothetical protein [Pseudomonas aeruginosa]MBG6884565.1 hypothetical protein [Pseudomonas aeruginosa]MBG7357025.1 hypothetical protein [Pseudomonas aeruginosa]MBI8651354.1 hypothetical protein [Pseudomonas aeruginosa]MBI8867827.1 hypothetical protein [Pseudomonas aeruginosa]